MSARQLAVLSSILLSGLLGCGGGDERLPLTLYSPHGRDLLELVEREYEADHPEVDLRWLDMGSQEVLDRLRSERANPQADVWFGGPSTLFARGANEGVLAPYVPEWSEAIPVGSRHPEGLYHGLYRTPAVLVFNTDALDPEAAPRDWDDLVSPAFAAQVLIRDPLASGTMRTVFGMILARAAAEGTAEGGFEWLARLDVNTRSYAQNPALLHAQLARREGTVTVWDLTDILFPRQRGAPVDYRFAASGTPVIDDSIGLVEGARHPEEAQRFIDWVGSRRLTELAAQQAYRLPARLDLPLEELPEWTQRVRREMTEAPLDWDLIAREGQGWMERWDREIRGRGADWLAAHSATQAAP